MKLKYYFAAAALASSLLVAMVLAGWVDSNATSIAALALPLFLIGSSAAWFLGALDRRLAELSRSASQLAEDSHNSTEVQAKGSDAVEVIARSLTGMQARMSALQTRVDQQRAIAEHAPDAMWELHVESGRIVDVNQRFADLSGYPREALIGMTPGQLGPVIQNGEVHIDDFMTELTKRLLTGERVVMPWTLIRKDGEQVACELRAMKLPSARPRTLVGGTLMDISERLRTERDLAYRLSFEALISRLSTEMISLKAEEIDDGIQLALSEIGRFAKSDRSYVFQFDADGEGVSCTHEWVAPGIAPRQERLQHWRSSTFGWAVARLQRGETLHVPRVADLPAEAHIERAQWEAESIQSMLLVPMRATHGVPGYVGFDWVREERRWPPEFVFLLTIFGEMVNNLLSRQEIDRELSQQRAALERSISELTRSNSELQRFAYAASHDLQEPLRAISGFSDLLARRYRGKLDATADEYLSFVRDAVTRMRSMIVNLLEYSRIDASPRPFDRCDLEEIFRLALSNLHASIEELNAHVHCEALPEVMGDASQLLQLLQNLVANAIKFHGTDEPEVLVKSERVADEWLVSVRDNGIGIVAADTERVFEVFKRLHPPDRYPGSGIGLSLCKRIIERHRGRIWAEPNRDAVGTTFYFTLPVMAADTTATVLPAKM